MKKILMLSISLLLLSACSNDDLEKTTCSIDLDQGSTKTKLTLIFESDENEVKKQIQESTMTFEDEKGYDSMAPIVKAGSLEKELKDKDGVTYKLDFNKSDLNIKESLGFDLEEISGELYGELTNQLIGDEKIVLRLDEILESVEALGYSCK